jgi:hypothetical protein
MADGSSNRVSRPETSRGQWSSFVAVEPSSGGKSRALNEEGQPQHRVRVEHDNHTLLIHVSDEDGRSWTTIAVDRATREWAIAQRDVQLEGAVSACNALYG